VAEFANRVMSALTRGHNWVQLAKFCAVGASGYVINLAVYTALLKWAGLHYLGAAVVSFCVAVSNNYWWNRHWTFVRTKGNFGAQGARFFVVSVAALLVNQVWLLVFLDWFGWGKIVSQAIAIILVTPLNFIGNKLWSFRAPQPARARAADTRSAAVTRR
jgi:putative flippase GtrA